MKKPINRTRDIDAIEAEVLTSGEAPPSDGFMELEDTTETDLDESDKVPVLDDTLPLESTPVIDVEPTLSFDINTIRYLGSICQTGMRGRSGQKVANLPVVVYSDKRVIGVVVLSDPGHYGEPIKILAEQLGFSNITYLYAMNVDSTLKRAVAYCLATQKSDPYLDVSSSVLSLGYTVNSLLGI